MTDDELIDIFNRLLAGHSIEGWSAEHRPELYYDVLICVDQAFCKQGEVYATWQRDLPGPIAGSRTGPWVYTL